MVCCGRKQVWKQAFLLGLAELTVSDHWGWVLGGLGKSHFTHCLCMYATGISGHQAAKLLRANGGKMAKLTIFMGFDFTKGPERGQIVPRGW